MIDIVGQSLMVLGFIIIIASIIGVMSGCGMNKKNIIPLGIGFLIVFLGVYILWSL